MTSTPPERPAVERPTDTTAATTADTSTGTSTGTPADTSAGRASVDTAPQETVDPLRGSRTSGAWIGLALLAVLLVLMIIFIAQNTQKVQVSFLGWNGQTPLAVALLAAVVTGLVVSAVAGSLRILQLRRRVKRSNR